MDINGEFSTVILPVLLILVGFHGVFYYRNMAMKAASWCLLQGSLGISFYMVGGKTNPFAQVLAFDTAVVGLGLVLVLFSAVLVFRSKYNTLDSEEIAKKLQAKEKHK